MRKTLKEATPAQHFDLPKGEPARFVQNGILETCQCTDCAALAATPAVPSRMDAIERRADEIDAAIKDGKPIPQPATPAVGGERCPHDMGFDNEIGPLGCRLVGQEMECVCEHMHFAALAAPQALAATPAVGGKTLARRLREHAEYLDSEGCEGTFAKDLMDAAKALAQPASPLRGRDTPISAIHEALKVANIEYAAFSCNGFNLVGDAKSIKEAASASHSHAQIDEFRTQIRHWREECGKLHARSAAPPEQPAAQIGENRALAKALDAAIHLINRYRTVASDIQFEQVLDAENDFGLALDELPDEPPEQPAAAPAADAIFDLCVMIVEEECYLDDPAANGPIFKTGLAIRDRIKCAQRNPDPAPEKKALDGETGV